MDYLDARKVGYVRVIWVDSFRTAWILDVYPAREQYVYVANGYSDADVRF